MPWLLRLRERTGSRGGFEPRTSGCPHHWFLREALAVGTLAWPHSLLGKGNVPRTVEARTGLALLGREARPVGLARVEEFPSRSPQRQDSRDGRGPKGEVIRGLQPPFPPGSVGVATPQKASSAEAVTCSPRGPPMGCTHAPGLAGLLAAQEAACTAPAHESRGLDKGKRKFPLSCLPCCLTRTSLLRMKRSSDVLMWRRIKGGCTAERGRTVAWQPGTWELPPAPVPKPRPRSTLSH